MLSINKLRSDHVVDFAAEELHKYLRMMMLELPPIPIAYNPDATEGFRLGLLEDFGIPFEGDDAALDDVVHIETTKEGGIIAGSNYRSILFAVYRYLKLCGCRFYAPGVDGEFIPRKPIEPQSYHKMADIRSRRFMLEGRPSFQDTLAYVDYHAKQELNGYGIATPFVYMARYYMHDQLEAHREPEPVDAETVHQMAKALECECDKRGMKFGGGNHDIIPELLGIDPLERELYKKGLKEPTEEMKSKMALLDGKRDLFKKDPFNTNFCMSRADLRKKYVDIVVRMAKQNPHYSNIACCLADLRRNHCECEECQKLHPTDFLVMIVNDIDEIFTREGIPTKLSFSTYVDQQFAPKVARVNNPKRVSMSFPPIGRTYSKSITKDTVFPETQPYVRNAWPTPRSVEENYAYLKKWQEVFPGNFSTYEYHFYVHQYRDPGLMSMSRRLYEDIQALKLVNLTGMTEDGSNKNCFPHGFMSHIYGQTLVDLNTDYDAAKEDYFKTCYGEDWKEALDYMEQVSAIFEHAYMCGDKPTDNVHSIYFDPARVKEFEKMFELAKKGRELAAAHKQMPHRIQVIHWRIMHFHTMWCEMVAKAMIEKCQGKDVESLKLWKSLVAEFSQYDIVLEKYFDMSLAAVSFNRLLAAVQPATDF